MKLVRSATPVVLTLFVLALVACKRDDDTASNAKAAPSTAPSAGATAVPTSSGCTVSPIEPGDHDRTLSTGGLDRTYILHVPPAYDGREPLPLVLNFHGYGSNARHQAAYSRFPAAADAEGFLVVTPEGAGTPQQWNIARLPALPDDIAFVRELIDALDRELCIDDARVYTAGISNGAAFSQQVACAMPERIAGVAVVAALFYPLACDTVDPAIPVIAFHGTEDACVPYGGGPVTCGAGRASIPAVEDSALNWARHDGCNDVPARQSLTDHVRTIAYSECDGETAVVLFVIEGGGHTWPGSPDVARLGATTHEIDATEQIWQFFEAQAALRESR